MFLEDCSHPPPPDAKRKNIHCLIMMIMMMMTMMMMTMIVNNNHDNVPKTAPTHPDQLYIVHCDDDDAIFAITINYSHSNTNFPWQCK